MQTNGIGMQRVTSKTTRRDYLVLSDLGTIYTFACLLRKHELLRPDAYDAALAIRRTHLGYAAQASVGDSLLVCIHHEHHSLPGRSLCVLATADVSQVTYRFSEILRKTKFSAIYARRASVVLEPGGSCWDAGG
jgi:hypothetical protein